MRVNPITATFDVHPYGENVKVMYTNLHGAICGARYIAAANGWYAKRGGVTAGPDGYSEHYYLYRPYQDARGRWQRKCVGKVLLRDMTATATYDS